MDNTTTEDRIETLLDRLNDPNLSDAEITRIERKIEVLQRLEQ